MPELDIGVQGAKRSRYYSDSPDALLLKTVERMPDATDMEIEESFVEEALKRGGPLVESMIVYWVTNNYPKLMRKWVSPELKRQQKAERERAQAEHKRVQEAQIEAAKRAAVTTIGRALLDKIAPACGKPLSGMTKADCELEGGWFIRLAAKLEPDQTVAAAGLTDQDLWELYSS